MISRVPTIDRRLLLRQCVVCGYDGALLRGGQAERCARCGCDLRQRPARSYAEMEGLLGQPLPLEPIGAAPPQQQGHAHKWLAFLFMSLLLIMVLGYLAASAFAV